MSKLIKFVTQKESLIIDELLMGKEYGFTTEQLMELAGLSCASSILKVFPPNTFKNVLTIAGPGNNGGDGLIASRHLVNFGYNVDVFYPKRSASNEHFQKLVLQSKMSGVKFIDNNNEKESNLDEIFKENKYNLIIDSIFGYSFSSKNGEIRAPFDQIINRLNKINQDKTPIASIDIPSGWVVDDEKGNLYNTFTPKLLISLCSPKICAHNFKGIHHLGGRFVPVTKEFAYLNLPEYPGSEQIVDISNLTQ